MADLHEFMVYEHAVCAGDLIIPHLLWVDDLVLFSESQNGLRQLNGLQRFCENNLMIANNLKIKAMLFGKAHEVTLTYNGNTIDVVRSYKYLGNVIHSIQKQSGDIFNHSHEYLSDKGGRAYFGLKHRLRKFEYLSPTVMLHMYDALISPVLTYGSDIWGHLRTCTSSADGVFFKFMKNTLSVKSSTSHLAVLGECGQLPPSIQCKINVLFFYDRPQNLKSKCIVKEVFDKLKMLHELGFSNWVTRVNDLEHQFNINLNATDINEFKTTCKMIVQNEFIKQWTTDLRNTAVNPKLRMFRTIKSGFGREPYIDLVNDARYRIAITKIRTSSYSLEWKKEWSWDIGALLTNKWPARRFYKFNFWWKILLLVHKFRSIYFDLAWKVFVWVISKTK